VEAIQDCDEALALDPNFVKVLTRKGRALLKLGQITEASNAFCFVLGWQSNEPETNKEEADKYGKDLARQAMKQVVLAKTLRDRLSSGSCATNKLIFQTADELLSLCPYLRSVRHLLPLSPSLTLLP
jgi:lipoate synthase